MSNLAKLGLVLVIVALVLVGTATTRSGKSADAWLGVYTQSVDADLARAFDLAVEHGAIVNEVVEDSPAEEAGLEDGDVIVAFDGSKVFDADDLLDLIDDSSPGDEIELTISRDGKEKQITVQLGKEPGRKARGGWGRLFGRGNVFGVPSMPAPPAAPDLPQIYSFSGGGSRSFLGVSLSDLSDQLGDYFGVEDGRGALITEVEDDSPADEAGLEAGDVIVAIEDEEVDDYDDVIDIVAETEEGDKVVVAVIRDRKELDIEVEIGERDDNVFFYGSGYDLAPQINIPRIHFDHQGSFGGADLYFDADEFKVSKGLKDDLRKELRNAIKELQKEFRKAIKELREELEG